MKKNIKLSLAIIIISLLLCLSGCGKSESEYKSAISEHMRSEHSVSVDLYESFSISDNGGASASVNVTAGFGDGGSIGMRAQLTVDEECNISSCSWCDLGI